MLPLLLLGALVATLDGVCCRPMDAVNEFKMLRYLATFGYVDPDTLFALPGSKMDAEITSALKKLQLYSGLRPTGLLDAATRSVLVTPRCGDPDVGVGPGSLKNVRFALQGASWNVRNLTYRVVKYPSACLSRDAVDAAVERAAQVWAGVAPVTLTSVRAAPSPAHVELRFLAGAHGDADAFDGPSGVLAHAHFPRYYGDAHLDDDEKWTLDSTSGTDLMRVAVHVLGHSLGLSHSAVPGAAMSPFFGAADPDVTLHKSDVDAIQAMYGKKEAVDLPAICEDVAVDTFFTDIHGDAIAFKGDMYYKVRDNRVVGHPRRIVDTWHDLPGDIDAAFTYSNGKTYFFKGDKYWRYKGYRPDGNYPRNISRGFPGVPDHVNAASVWSGDSDGRVYFFKGSQFWGFDLRQRGRLLEYPRPLLQWRGLPDRVDAALRYRGRSYVFKGGKYYRLNGTAPEVETADPAFPRPTGRWWFGC